MATKRRPTYVTPAGTAIWPSLNRPDDRPINGKPVTPAYKVRLRFPAEVFCNEPVTERGQSIGKSLKELLDEAGQRAFDEARSEAKVQVRKTLTQYVPYIEELDEQTEEPTGYYVVSFKANAEFKDKQGRIQKVSIGLFDAKGNPVTEDVGSGSTIKVAFSIVPFMNPAAKNAGVTLRLRAAQVLSLVPPGGGTADSFGFGVEEGYEAPPATETARTESAGSDETTDGGDDDFDADF